MTKDEALKLALESLEHEAKIGNDDAYRKERDAIKQALEQPPHQTYFNGVHVDPVTGDVGIGTPKQPEPVTVLPDGSAFAVMSYPLPKDHWLYAERQYNDGEDEPVELGKAILTHEMRDAVVSAVRYAIRGATNCGKENDFDPDALVLNAVYALCGPYTSPPKREPEPVAYQDTAEKSRLETVPAKGTLLHTSPLKREPLTDEQIWYVYVKTPVDFGEGHVSDLCKFARAIEAAHGIGEIK
jgi:hypothetical protein